MDNDRMAYDEGLAQRVRDLVVGDLDVTEKRMFGGLAFLVNGHMSVTVSGRGGLMVRLDQEDAGPLLDGRVVVPFEMRGKPMKGWLRVGESGFESDEQLREWVERSVEFARTLPHHT
jgi:TfoX/Sxy family transcriptional regulator of competence genes